MLRCQICGLKYLLKRPLVFYSARLINNERTKQIPLIQKLSEEFSDIAPIKFTLEKDEIKNTHFSEWKSRIDVMKSYLFSELESFKMISRYPLLLKIPLEKFETTIRRWYFAELGQKSFQQLLLNQPILFEIDEETIESRLPQLLVLFRTKEALTQLLIYSPNVMYDNWHVVVEKIHYLLKVRKYKMGDILHSCALSKSLEFIKLRLELLEKCGIYKQDTKPIHKINKYDKSKHKNPSLHDILLTNIKSFSQIAKITPEEYATYRDLHLSYSDEASDYDSDLKSKYNEHKITR